MSAVEAEGSSIDEAIEQALRRLGVTRDRVEIEILANATRGIFGIGARKARVRASLRAAVGEARPDPVRAERHPDSAESRPPRQVEPVRKTEPPPAETAAAPRRDPAPPRAQTPPVPIDPRTIERARTVLQEVIALIGSEATVEICDDGEGPALAISGDETGILIGRRGQTLDALEYVVGRIVARDDEQGTRIGIDSQNYRARRRAALTAMAHRLADQARRRRKPVTLNPMSPRDRRIVHLALQDAPALTTRSLGTGYFRKLVIIPGGGRGPRRE